MDDEERLRNEIRGLETKLDVKRQELEKLQQLKARKDDRGWEVAWYQQLLLMAGCSVDPETLKDGLTYEEACVERIRYAVDFQDAVGVVIIVRRSPPKEVKDGEETVL